MILFSFWIIVPNTAGRAITDALLECGVTRVSLGAQTFSPRLLDVLERHAIALQERRAQALAVVREDHEAVRTGCVRGRLGERLELLLGLLELLIRLREVSRTIGVLSDERGRFERDPSRV